MVEIHKEKCEYCKRTVTMVYITYKIQEPDGEYYVTKHEIELRQCSFCKLIQSEGDD